MMKNDNVLVKRSNVIRYCTSKTGTHVVYFDCVSGHQRRLNLTIANLRIVKQK